MQTHDSEAFKKPAFISYLRAKELLKARFSDITPEEIALWLAYGDEGIAARDSAYANAKAVAFRHELGFAQTVGNKGAEGNA